MSRVFLTSKSQIVIRTGGTPVANENVIVDLSAYTIKVNAEMDMQAFYSALMDYWHNTAGMSMYSFPFNAIDDTSAKYQLGYDGTTYNGWNFLDVTSKKNIKNAGFRIYNTNGTIAEEWFGVITPPGQIADTDQPYYILVSTDAPTNFTFTGPVNEPIQVYGDATHGSFDKRTFFKMFVREQGKVYASAQLSDAGRTKTGPYAQSFGLANSTDLKITHNDATVNAAPYTNLTITYYASNQLKTIGTTANIPFKIVIDNTTANMTRYQIYERIQYLLRQTADIDGAGGTASGKVADQVCYFVGETLYTNAFIQNLAADDINSVIFIDANGTQRQYPYAASGTFQFNSVLQTAGAKYTVYFKTVGTGFGTAGAIVVNDKDGNPLSGTINSRSSIGFTFDYDGNTQGSRAPATNALCEIVVTAPGVAKYTIVEFTITRANGQNVSVSGVVDPVYVP